MKTEFNKHLIELKDVLRNKDELKRRYIEKPLCPTEEEKSDMKIFEIMVGGVRHAGVRAYLQTQYLSSLRTRLEEKAASDPKIRKDFDDLIAYRWREIIRMGAHVRELEAVGIL